MKNDPTWALRDFLGSKSGVRKGSIMLKFLDGKTGMVWREIMKSETMFLISMFILAANGQAASGGGEVTSFPISGPAQNVGYKMEWSDGLCIRAGSGDHMEILTLEASRKNGTCSPQRNYSDAGIETAYANLQNSPPEGIILVTSAENRFMRYRNSETGALGWEDLSNGMVLYDLRPEKFVNQFEAEVFCKRYGLKLPSGYPKDLNGKHHFPKQDSNFVTLNEHGIHEVVKDLWDAFLWSSSVHPKYSDSAYGLKGGPVRAYFDTIEARSRHHSARCVGMAGNQNGSYQ